MQSVYGDMLDLALSKEGPGKALVADLGTHPQIVDRKTSGQYFIDWKKILPDSCTIHTLPGDETFLQHLDEQVTLEGVKHLFVFPPVISWRHLSKDLRRYYQRLDLQQIVALNLVEALPDGMLVGLLLPAGSMVTRGAGRFREALFQKAALKIMITHGESFLQFPAPVQMTTIILETGKAERAPMKFFKSPDSAEEQKLLADFEKLLHQGGGKTKYGYVHREPLPRAAPLIFEKYHPDLLAKKEDMRHFAEVRPLDELVDIRMGLRVDRRETDTYVRNEEGVDGIPIISGSHIHNDGTIEIGQPRYRLLEEGLANICSGDICLRRILGPSQKQLPLAEVDESHLPMAADQTVIILHPKDDISEADRDLLLAFLRSKRVVEYIKAEGVGFSIFPSILVDLLVPRPDEALTLSIKSLNSAIEQFTTWGNRAVEERSQLFSLFDEYASAKEARLYLLSTGRIARQRVEAALRVTNFEYRARTQYPHPIAYRWRKLQSSRPDFVGYKQLLDCAEAALCYLAFMTLTLTRSLKNASLGYKDTMARRLSGSDPRGTNLGDWVAILREARDSRKLRTVEDLVPFYEVLHFLREDSVDDAVQVLKGHRDDDAHGRGPTEVTIEEDYNQAHKRLEILLRAVEFIAEYPLRFIEKTRRDSLLGVTQYEYRDLMGDHPLVPISSAETDDPELEAGSLYLVDRTGNLHLLRPYLIRERCPECGRLSTFILDTYLAKEDCCTLKSLEVGHTVMRTDISQAFREVGLLFKE